MSFIGFELFKLENLTNKRKHLKWEIKFFNNPQHRNPNNYFKLEIVYHYYLLEGIK